MQEYGKMAQWVRSLLSKHEDLIWDSQQSHKRTDEMMCACDPSTGKQRRMDSETHYLISLPKGRADPQIQ